MAFYPPALPQYHTGCHEVPEVQYFMSDKNQLNLRFYQFPEDRRLLFLLRCSISVLLNSMD